MYYSAASGRGCLVCGLSTSPTIEGDILDERPEWRALKRKRHSLACTIIPAAELEQMEFINKPSLWSRFHRFILVHPETKAMSVSGINPGRTRLATESYDQARIKGSQCGRFHKHIRVQPADIFSSRNTTSDTIHVGYSVHAHCWLLVDHFIGHQVLVQNLALFVKAAACFWKNHKRALKYNPFACPLVTSNEEDNSEWIKRLRIGSEKHQVYNAGSCFLFRYSVPANPFRIPEVERLISRVLRDANTPRLTFLIPSCLNIPQSVAMMIVDAIYEYSRLSLQRINDIRNMLEAFEWVLPDAYWTSRYNAEIFFEIDDLLKSGARFNLANLVLGLEELILSEHWYCRSGLYNRGRTLKMMNGIKKEFLRLLKLRRRRTTKAP